MEKLVLVFVSVAALTGCTAVSATITADNVADVASGRYEEIKTFRNDVSFCHRSDWQKRREADGKPCSDFLKADHSAWDKAKIVVDYRSGWRDDSGNWIGPPEKYKERWGGD